MLGVILRVIACLLFLLAAVGQTIFSQPPADLIAWGLLAWCLAALWGSYDFAAHFNRPPA